MYDKETCSGQNKQGYVRGGAWMEGVLQEETWEAALRRHHVS